ncbi:hypothetical protein BTUL_0321g00070 [Botrytis tulipae]|uniref:Uncharacterized protein n=1 Tax=Botrytis tulipae TaxID=87230 RepID=A0A4Z1E514_9HELO|nr:hypothetical protein BTUL_0321g00070 [Botrytis tulipae]
MKKQNLEPTIKQSLSQTPKTCFPSQPMQIFTKAEFDQIGVNIVNRQKKILEEIRDGTRVARKQTVKGDIMDEIKRRKHNLLGASFTSNRLSTTPMQQTTRKDTLSAVPGWLQTTSTHPHASVISSSFKLSTSNTCSSSFEDTTHNRDIVSFEFETIDDSEQRCSSKRRRGLLSIYARPKQLSTRQGGFIVI